MHSIIIGTAGHVDHGKTEIVKALTGRDTDRLAEEKERGISIVLGFAPLDLSGDLKAGVVDVPGHERFVKNMVSGAVGVDLALLVVAADEGVMPQTREHFEVLRLLGVGTGVIAITKVDLVDAEMADLVESEVRDLVAGTPFDRAPLLRTSVVTGEGLEALRAALAEGARSIIEKEKEDIFRMPIDRVFTRSGIGTIVTGTVWSGTVGKGDSLVIEPSGIKVRIREVHSFDHATERAGAGQRAALALHGVRVDQVAIGEQVVTPSALSPSSMLDCVVETSSIEGAKIANRQRVRVHHAAGEVLARAVLLDSDEIGPGEMGLLQLRLERRSVARGGDRFVIRSYSPMHVIGGGRVLDPAPSKAKRFKDKRLSFLRTMAEGAGEEAASALLHRAGAVGLAPGQMVVHGFTPERGAALLSGLAESGAALQTGGIYFAREEVDALERSLFETVERFVRSNPLAWGIERETLRERIGIGPGPLFDHILASGLSGGALFFKGSLVRAGAGDLELAEGDRAVLGKLKGLIEEGGFAFPTKIELGAVEPDEKRLMAFMRMLQEEGAVTRVLSYGYIDSAHLGRMLEQLRGHLAGHHEVSVGEFKELFGLSRKYAVPLLEFLDHEGYTKRAGDARVSGPRMEELTGSNE